MELHLPTDYDRLQEFRLLLAKLGGLAQATYAWVRLWVELAYSAQITNKPGRLDEDALELYRAAMAGELPAGVDVVQALEESRVLTRDAEGVYFCDRFSRMNPHTSGLHRPAHVRGAEYSAHERRKPKLAAEALYQSTFLPRDIVHRRDGTPLTGVEIQRAMLLIKTLDHCLMRPGEPRPPRRHEEYTEGLIVDAAEVVCNPRYSQEGLELFYRWVMDNRDRPGVPALTEQLLPHFDELYRLVQP